MPTRRTIRRGVPAHPVKWNKIHLRLLGEFLPVTLKPPRLLGDNTAGDAVAGVAGRIAHEVVSFGVDHE